MKPHLLVLLCLVVLMIAACAQQEAATVPSTPIGTVPVEPARSTPAATVTLSPTLSPLAESSLAEDRVDATMVAPLPTIALDPPEQVCGALLPHRLDSTPTAVTSVPNALPPTQIPAEAMPAWQRLVDAPETIGLVAYEIGQEEAGVYLNADVPMPLASVVKVVNLVAYAQAVENGRLNPAEWLPLNELDRYYLPGSDLRAHQRALEELEESNLVAYAPPATPMEQVPWMMIRHSSNAASDYLHMTLGQETIERTVLELGLNTHTAPCPFLGQFLIMSSRSRPGNDLQAVQRYIQEPDRYGRDVMQLAENYAYDPVVRERERAPRWERPSLEVQALFSDRLNAQGTAGEYATLMARLLNNGLSSDYVNILVRRVMEWPMIFPTNQALFSAVGYKNGSLPGVLTTVYYARRLEDGAGIVVALFYRQLPENVYRSWRQTLPHDEFARWLLGDPSAIPALRAQLNP